MKFFSAGYVLFCVPKENQKGRRCPQGMKAPVGLLSRRPNTKQMPRVQRGKVSATFEAAGYGSLRLLRALDGTRILKAAGQQLLFVSATGAVVGCKPEGCSPLIIPKQMGPYKKSKSLA